MRRARLCPLAVTFAALIALACEAPARPQDWADILLLEQQSREPIPVLSFYEPEFDLDYAYEVQRAYVEKVRSKREDDGVLGLLAGPNDKYMRVQYNLDGGQAVTATLLRSWRLRSGAKVLLRPYRRPVLANAYGFVLSRPVTAPVAGLAALRPLVKAIVPVVIVSDLSFGADAEPRDLDLIAANLGTRAVIVGEPQPVALEVNRTVVNLAREGRGQNWVRADSAGGDQWGALLGLLNEALERGARLEAGQLLVTGALGRLVPATPGRWTADYQSGGRIDFELR